MNEIMERKCLHCGSVFRTRDPELVYCNQGCRFEAESEAVPGVRAVCLQCGGTFFKARNNQKFCSSKCYSDYHRLSRAYRGLRPIKCEICGRTVKPKATNQVYCSDCARKHHAEACRERMREICLKRLYDD